MCRLLEVSRSGYYAARKRCGLAPVAFAASGRAYGSRRLRAALQKQGVTMGRNRVRSLMRANGLRSVWKRKFVHTTNSQARPGRLAERAGPAVRAAQARSGLGV